MVGPREVCRSLVLGLEVQGGPGEIDGSVLFPMKSLSGFAWGHNEFEAPPLCYREKLSMSY